MGERAFFDAFHAHTKTAETDEIVASHTWWRTRKGWSTLQGVIATLRAGQKLTPEQIDELERTLKALQDRGWSGSITADQAVKALAQDR